MSSGHLNDGLSFWDLKQYMRTVKRLESANKLCSDLNSLIHERANIENAYAENLKKWSSRWSSFIDSGLEYRSGAHPWLAACKEAEQISAIHKKISEDLITKDQVMIKKWQKEKFHKSTLPPTSIKEAKQLESDFESHQKPWAKKIKKVQSSKSDYHSASKSVKSLKIQLENAKNDPSGTAEQIKKIEEKLRKAEKDEEKTMESYKNALYELDVDKPRYMDGLTSVFESAQEFELQRLEYFKEVFYSLHEHLDISKITEIPQIYTSFKETIGKSNPSEDLAYWSANHGVDMPANFPSFEEFTPELNSISKKKSGNDTGVTLTNISPAIPNSPQISNSKNTAEPLGYGFTTGYDYNQNQCESNMPPPSVPPTNQTGNSINRSPNEDYTFNNSALYDDGSPGVAVQALYDYKKQEDDEISFSAGDVFEKLEDEDEQGWCKGRKNGKVGLYPANYVKTV